jgi:hypothetical protein
VERWEEEQRRKRTGSVLPPSKGTNVALIEDFEDRVNAMWVNMMKAGNIMVSDAIWNAKHGFG